MNEYLKEYYKYNHKSHAPYVSFAARENLVREYSFAIPNDEAISTIVYYSPIIEIGAGSGYWAKLISEAGGDIVAVDNKCKKDFFQKEHYPTINGDERQIDNYPGRTLFMCWAEEGDTAYKIIDRFMKNNGQVMIIIEEGCTGGIGKRQEFFEIEKTVVIPNWIYIRDTFTVWRRK